MNLKTQAKPMARKLVTKEHVDDLANDMKLAGKVPSVLSLHKALGHGSYSTIRKYLDEWESKNTPLEREQEQKAEEDIPEALSQNADLFIRRLWVMAQGHESALLASERAVMDEQTQLQKKETEQIVDASNALVQRIDDLEDALAQSRQSYQAEHNLRMESEQRAGLHAAALERSQADLKLALPKLETLAEKYEKKIEEAASLHSTISSLHADTSRLNGELHQKNEAFSRLQQQQEETKSQLVRKKNDNSVLENKILDSAKRETELKTDIQHVREESKRLTIDNATLGGQLEERLRQSSQLETRLSDASVQIEKLKLDKAKQTKKSPASSRRKKPSSPEGKPT
jgi:DNA repair exonuclease SbcCD ATPase subunit